jgi:hypothetical protein
MGAMWMWQSVIKFVVSSQQRIHKRVARFNSTLATVQCSFTEDLTPASKQLGTSVSTPEIRV